MANRDLGPHFYADIHFLPRPDGTIRTFLSGYRPALFFPQFDEENHWLIFPRFLDENGQEVPDGVPLAQDVRAAMYCLDQNLWETVHRPRLTVGTRFEVAEGFMITAAGVVTELLR